ncbi:unnamed protein product, partial [Allacma fusca]
GQASTKLKGKASRM